MGDDDSAKCYVRVSAEPDTSLLYIDFMQTRVLFKERLYVAYSTYNLTYLEQSDQTLQVAILEILNLINLLRPTSAF